MTLWPSFRSRSMWCFHDKRYVEAFSFQPLGKDFFPWNDAWRANGPDAFRMGLGDMPP